MHEPRRSAEFYTALAPHYDILLGQQPGNVWVRAAFHQFVQQFVPPPQRLLDFGCGTGIDAGWYMQQNYQVLAYDNALGMLDQLITKYAANITAGSMTVYPMDYAAFLAQLQTLPLVKAIVANFAVLNTIDDLPTLFKAWAAYLHPQSYVIVSVLNPFYWQDMASWWWWRAWWRSQTTQAICYHSAMITTYRHFIPHIIASAQPYFKLLKQVSVATLINYYQGEYQWEQPRTWRERFDKRYGQNRLGQHLGRYIFLAFERVSC